MSPVTLKVLIVHVTSPNPEQLKDRLDTLELFPKHYDGNEMTMGPGFQILSQRFYYYDVPSDDLLLMLRHLHQEGVDFDYQVKINPQGQGNHKFD